jgi:uncharacterized membrane protein YbhN (UPF0104 family)
MSPDSGSPAVQSFPPGVRARLAWLVKLVLSSCLLWYIATRISLQGLAEALAAADPVLVGLGLALSAGGMAAAAQQLRAVGERQGIHLSTRDALALNLATSFYNLFLPGSIAGGVARWYRLARSHSTEQPAAALAVILGSRVVELATVLVAGLVFWAADPLARSSHLVPAVFIGLLAALVRLAAASVARHLLMIGGFYCFALALRLPLTLAVAGWTRTVVALAGMLPVTLGGLGVREGSLIAVLHPYGVPPHGAAALGLLLFGREVLAGAVGAVLEARWFLSPGAAAARARWKEPSGAEAGD